MPNTTEKLVVLTQWLRSLDYMALRNAESRVVVDVTFPVNKKNKSLNAVRLAPDLCLGRDKRFYKIIDGHAVVMPASLVAEQYDVKALMKEYQRARNKAQPRVKKKSA